MYYILYKYSEVGFVFVSLQEKKELWNDLLFISFFEKKLGLKPLHYYWYSLFLYINLKCKHSFKK